MLTGHSSVLLSSAPVPALIQSAVAIGADGHPGLSRVLFSLAVQRDQTGEAHEAWAAELVKQGRREEADYFLRRAQYLASRTTDHGENQRSRDSGDSAGKPIGSAGSTCATRATKVATHLLQQARRLVNRDELDAAAKLCRQVCRANSSQSHWHEIAVAQTLLAVIRVKQGMPRLAARILINAIRFHWIQKDWEACRTDLVWMAEFLARSGLKECSRRAHAIARLCGTVQLQGSFIHREDQKECRSKLSSARYPARN